MTDTIHINGKAPLATKLVEMEQTVLFGVLEPVPSKMDVLCISSAYGNLPPGDGASECVYDPTKYVWLPKKFRYILSDQCVLAVPFSHKGKNYASIWHALEAAKYFYAGFRAVNYSRMLQLAESSYAFSVNPIGVASPVALRDSELKGWDEAKERDAIYHAVFLQCPVRQQALLATQDATLNCQIGNRTFHFKHLEHIRAILRRK